MSLRSSPAQALPPLPHADTLKVVLEGQQQKDGNYNAERQYPFNSGCEPSALLPAMKCTA